MKPPMELGREEVRKYQLYLHDERKLQPGTVKGHLCRDPRSLRISSH
jgi:hypothetical protein